MNLTAEDPPPGCTCGAYWSVIPPGPCPHHSLPGYEWRLAASHPPQSTRWYPTTTTTTGTIRVGSGLTHAVCALALSIDRFATAITPKENQQ